MAVVIKKPAKEEVRNYIGQRVAEHAPPPSAEEIRRRLGWHLIEAKRATTRR